MGLVTGIAIYFVIWWITLFVVLPFGVEQNKNVKLRIIDCSNLIISPP